MTIRIWNGSTAPWTAAGAWEGGVVPLPDDTAVVTDGTVEFGYGDTLDAGTIDLDSAALSLDGALLGVATTLDSTTADAQAVLLAEGPAAFNGVLNATASGGNFTITAQYGSLTLLEGADVTDSGGDVMRLNGVLDNQSTVTIGSGGDFVNDGTIVQASAAMEVQSGGTLGGTGTFEIGLFSSLNFQTGSAPSSEDVRFTDVGGRLLLANPANFTGVIHNFETGDLIDLTSITADAASYNAATGLLSVSDDGAIVAMLTLDAPAGTTFTASSGGNGGTMVQLVGSQPRVDYLIDAGDRAMGANIVRETMTTPGGTPLTGAGVRIGIISDSFDEAPGIGTADVANAAAEAGLLPETANGTSAVTVLSDAYGSGDDNEGLAMAELVHQVAPGASIDFATGGYSTYSFADAVSSLQQAGCNVIVDDQYYFEEPFFTNDGVIDDTIESAVSEGVSYFASAGNTGAAAYQSTFTATPETLYNGTSAPAQLFDNGTPYQTVTLTAGVDSVFDLQWYAPYAGFGATLQAELYDMSGRLVASSPYTYGTQTTLDFTPSVSGQYQLAITGDVPAGTTFKYILFGQSGGGTGPGGIIDDPAANASTVMGHAMLPDVTSVGAVDFPETPAFGSTNDDPEYYSSTGNPEILGTAYETLATPQVIAKPNILAPVDSGTSVSGFSPFGGTSAAAPEAAGVAALMLQANPSLTPAEIQADLEASATDVGQPATVEGAGEINAVGAVDLALGVSSVAACYAAGTRIATHHGTVAIEELRVGERVVTASGALRPIVWLGHRQVDCLRHPCPSDVWPVRVQTHAFAPGQPARDLFLSPDHAVHVGEVLIPVRYLLNGATIAQVPVPAVTYWHVELPVHDLVLAEGLPCESYLDTGNRAAFTGSGERNRLVAKAA